MFSIYLYADDLMQWTTSDADGGINGIGENSAQVGYIWTQFSEFYKYLLPGSQTCSIIEVSSRSNVNISGMFVLAPKQGVLPIFGRQYQHLIVTCIVKLMWFVQWKFVKREMFVWWTVTLKVEEEWSCVLEMNGGVWEMRHGELKRPLLYVDSYNYLQ